MHFDLKCDNVLTARQLGIAGGVTCKVADFGLSKQQKGTAVGVSLGGSSSLTAGNNAGGHNPGHGSRNPQGHREFTSGPRFVRELHRMRKTKKSNDATLAKRFGR